MRRERRRCPPDRESGQSFAVIEKAVETIRERLDAIEPTDPDVLAILRAHLLAIGSPSDVLKFFSVELIERAANCDPSRCGNCDQTAPTKAQVLVLVEFVRAGPACRTWRLT